MKTLTLILMLATAGSGCVHGSTAAPASGDAARLAVPDFSGKWTPDVEKNGPRGGGGGGGAGTGGGRGGMRGADGSGDMTIAQDARRLTIVRPSASGDIKTVYELDGRNSRVTTGAGEQVAMARWMSGTLVVDRTVPGPTGSQIVTTRWYLEAGDLVIETASPARGDVAAGVRKTYYKKAS